VTRDSLTGKFFQKLFCLTNCLYRDGINDWAYDGSEGVDFEAFLRLSTIDFGTLHLYPEDWEKSSDESWATKFILDHIAAAKSVGKPVLLEEYGYKDQSQRNRMYQTWLDVVYNNDGAGDLVWMLAADVGGVPYPDYDHYTIYKTSAAMDVISPHITRMRQKNTCFECRKSYNNVCGVAVRLT
jgi:mannan endo-1,4-beta-mannosidase